jgi:hypothetical protein
MINKRKITAFLIAPVLILLILVGCQHVYRISTPSSMPLFRFVVMGDSRGVNDSSPINTAELSKLADLVAALDPAPEFVLFVGDLAYSGGTTQLNSWKAIMSTITNEGIELYPTVGNHELGVGLSTGQQDYRDAFILPENGPTGYSELVFSFECTNSLFVCLDSYYYDGSTYYSNQITEEQTSWLSEVLSSSDKAHKFVFAHSPAYPVNGHVGSSLDTYPAKRDAFWEILDNNNADIFFAGHEHVYSRWKIDSAINVNWQNEVYQVISGGSGAPLGAKNLGIDPDAFASKYHYIVVDVAVSEIIVYSYDDQGSIIDNFTITK